MARARNIKPGLLKNEILGVADPLYTLLFEGLWLLADREGRLEDRPLRIKAEVFPYRDGLNVDEMLAWLADHKFIRRYRVGGVAYIQVENFTKHQSPHKNEAPSGIPSPSESLGTTSEEIGTTRADSLIPDSLIPEVATPNGVAGHRHDDAPHLALVSKSSQSIPDCPHLEVLALWSTVLPALPRHDPDQWRGSREDHLRARWRETATAKRWPDKAAGLAYLGKLFAYVGQSDFLTGRVTPRQPGRKPFVCTLAWLVKPENWAKTIEGEYHQDAA